MDMITLEIPKRLLWHMRADARRRLRITKEAETKQAVLLNQPLRASERSSAVLNLSRLALQHAALEHFLNTLEGINNG